jgi:hypothetical protein
MRIKITVNFLFAFLFIVPVLVYSSEFEPIAEKHLTILNKVTLKIRSNMESIRTWQGKVLYKRKQPTGKWVDDMEIIFFVDRVSNKRLVVSKHIKTEIDGAEIPLDIDGLFLTDDLYYGFHGWNLDGIIPVPDSNAPNSSRNIHIKDVLSGKEKDFQQSYIGGSLQINLRANFKLSEDNLKQNFNPFVVLLDREQDPVYNSTCQYLIEVIRQKVVHDCDIRIKYTDNDPIVEISYKYPKAKEPNRYLFDLTRGGNCTYSRIPNFGDAQLREVEYGEISGVWVPRKVDFKLRQAIHETIEFVEQKINEPIDSDSFSLATLGVRRGDSCFDARTQVSSIITDATFPERTQITLPKKISIVSSIFSIVLICMGIILIWIAIVHKLPYFAKSK